MAYVYVLRATEHDRLYVGSTRDLERRLKAHNTGKVRSTKTYRPWKIAYFEEYNTYTDARKRENFFKSGAGRTWLDNKLKR